MYKQHLLVILFNSTLLRDDKSVLVSPRSAGETKFEKVVNSVSYKVMNYAGLI